MAIAASPEITQVSQEPFEKDTPMVYSHSESIPHIIITRPSTVPNIALGSVSAYVNNLSEFNHLQVQLPPLRRHQVLKSVSEQSKQYAEQAKESEQRAKQLGINLAKKNFFIKLIAVCVSLVVLGIAIGATVGTTGAASPFVAVMGVITAIAIADMFCALADWQLKSHGHKGLPCDSCSVANATWGLFYLCGWRSERSVAVAKVVAIVIKIVITIGTIWAAEASPDTLIDPDAIGGTLATLAEECSKRYFHIEDTEDSLKEWFEKSVLDAEKSKQENREKQFIEGLVKSQLAAEVKFEDRIKARVKKDYQAALDAQAERDEAREQLELIEEAIKQVGNILEPNVIEAMEKVVQQPIAIPENIDVSDDKEAQLHLGGFNVKEVSLRPYLEELSDLSVRVRELRAKYEQSLRDAHKQKVRHSRNTFLGKMVNVPFSLLGVGGAVATSVVTMGAATPLAVFMAGICCFAVSDAVSAYVSWQNVRHEQDELQFGSDSVANSIYYVFHNTDTNQETLIKVSERVSIGLRIVLTLGSLWPKRTKVNAVEQIELAASHIESVTDVATDKLEEPAVMDSAELNAHKIENQFQIIEEAIEHQQIIFTAYNDAMEAIKHEGQAHLTTAYKHKLLAQMETEQIQQQLAQLKQEFQKLSTDQQQKVMAFIGSEKAQELLIEAAENRYLPVDDIDDSSSATNSHRLLAPSAIRVQYVTV